MEFVPESVGVALKIIDDIIKIADNVLVNKHQCKRLAERLCDISKGLGILIIERKEGTFLEYIVVNQVLPVLKKVQALIQKYADVRNALRNILSRADNYEAFKEVHEEIDYLGTYLNLDQTEKNKLLSSDAETDRGEIIHQAHKLILGDAPKDNGSIPVYGDMEGAVEHMEKAVTEKCYFADSTNAKNLSYLNIPHSAIRFDRENKELRPWVERKTHINACPDDLAVVCKGTWMGCDVAIKVFKSADIHWKTEELHREIASLVKLGHPHITQLIGCAQHDDETYVLYEWMASDLRSLIECRMQKKKKKSLQVGPPFTHTEVVSIISQIARGMLYLHEKELVHGELICSNLLVEELGDHIDVKVADFRCSRQLGQAPTNKYEPAHRPRWMPPEAFQHFNVDQPSAGFLKKVDVYSFAMTCYEVLTGKLPFDGVRPGKFLEEKIMAGERPELPDDLDEGLKRLITECWHEDPEQRPSFQDIGYVLKVYAVNPTSQVETLFFNCLGIGNQEPVRDVLEGKEWSDLLSELNELKVRSIREINDATMDLPHYLNIRPSDLKPLRLLGKGTSGEVFEASWLGCKFAVKWLKVEDAIKLRQDVSILMKLLHPHVIRLVGFSVLANRCAFVMELMDMSLRDLMDCRIKDNHLVPFSESEALCIIRRLALGMAFLHSRGVTHRDLKCANVLIGSLNSKSSYFHVKIANFGLSKLREENSPDKQFVTVGASGWLAPEIFKNMESQRPGKIDFKAADVYSFAMTCYEVLTGKLPFDDIRGKVLGEKIKGGERPELPKVLNQGLRRLITECWHADPKNRPSFRDICYVLKILKVKFSSYLEIGSQESVARKGFPTRNWCSEEIQAMLELTEEALRGNEWPDLWDYVSENLWEEYGFDRSSNSCQQQWGTLLQSYRAIQDLESKIQSGTSNCTSSWKLNEDERSNKKLLQAFDLEWCEMIERILTVKSSQMDADMYDPALPYPEKVLYQEVMNSIETNEDNDTHSETGESSEIESTATADCRAEDFEDDLISRIAPFVNKQIEDAFKPLSAVMRRHQEKLIT